jgi:hypothetical protein
MSLTFFVVKKNGRSPYLSVLIYQNVVRLLLFASQLTSVP